MDVSLGALRRRLLEFRSWDSSGKAFDIRVRESLNFALDRMAGDVPEALIPSEEHIVLHADVKGTDSDVAARLAYASSTDDYLKFVDTAGTDIGASSLTTWRPTIDGTWDGIMHLEITDSDGVKHRRQSREWWKDGNAYYVSLDRPWRDDFASDISMDFRIHQPEFFVSDDVMEVLEPARIWDSSRQQVWAIDTAGAYRQDMVDFQGESQGRPYRFWRGRHYQIPAPHEVPDIEAKDYGGQPPTGIFDPPDLPKEQKTVPDPINVQLISKSGSTATVSTSLSRLSLSKTTGLRTAATAKIPKGAGITWVGPVAEGAFQFCYTYVWGRRDEEWQDAPLGTRDPQWESAPSPISSVMNHEEFPGSAVDILITNIDAMLEYDTFASSGADFIKRGKSGLRIRIYVARLDVRKESKVSTFDRVESSGKFYLLTEIEPVMKKYTWTGAVTPDYHRPLKHSTGYYAHKVYPHQDARYEVDLRVLRLPRKFVSDQDTAPIQRDSVPALLELALYYLCLQDGVDQQSATLHLDRYNELARRYRMRYANPGRIVEPVPIYGHTTRKRFGTFSNST